MLSSHMLPSWSEIGVGFANHIWQSTLFMFFVGALALLFKRNSAVVRYRLWLIASVKFLVPFSLFVGLGGLLQWHPVRPVTPSEVPVVVRQISQPFTQAPIVIPPPAIARAMPVARPFVGVAIGSVWLIGVVAVVLVWFLRWLRIARIVRNAEPLDANSKSSGIRILTSRAGMEPGVFGIFRPVLLLPEGLTRNLPAVQLEPIIAHEMFHVRGRDNLAAAMHTIVQALFWFHPLVWWLGTRLVDERERACDEAVLQSGHDPAAYAEGILRVCKSNLMMPACVAGVSGSNLKKRIEVIMENRGTIDLTAGKKLLLTFAGAGMVIFPVFAGMITAAEAESVQVFTTMRPTQYEKVKNALAAISQASAVQTAPKASAVRAVTLQVIEQATGAGLPVLSQAPVRAPQAGQTANDQQKWLDDVSIIITDEERRAFQRLTKDSERQGFITNFWLARDPTPGTPANEFRDEYNRRFAYANEHFTTQAGIPGSKTDRGKMYILNGPPDEILSHPSGGTYYRPTDQGGGVTNTYPFEQWRYRNLNGKGANVVYEFVDKQVNGEYTLEYDPGAKSK